MHGGVPAGPADAEEEEEEEEDDDDDDMEAEMAAQAANRAARPALDKLSSKPELQMLKTYRKTPLQTELKRRCGTPLKVDKGAEQLELATQLHDLWDATTPSTREQRGGGTRFE